jgi:hypothetical protein
MYEFFWIVIVQKRLLGLPDQTRLVCKIGFTTKLLGYEPIIVTREQLIKVKNCLHNDLKLKLTRLFGNDNNKTSAQKYFGARAHCKNNKKWVVTNVENRATPCRNPRKRLHVG